MEKKKRKVNSKNSKSNKSNKVNKNNKMKFRYKHPKLSIALKILLVMIVILLVIGAGVIIGLMCGVWGDDFKIDISELVLSENSTIVDTDGNVLAVLTGDENRKIVTLEEMSPYLPKAYVSIEDERFEKHHGVDIKRTGAAVLSFITHGGHSTAGGGSTITQQLVKNVTQDKESSGIDGVLRKIKEWTKAYQVENVLSKDQILELYLNLIFVGGKQDNRGVEIASEYYFNKTAKDLTIAQCAFLAGINHSPNRYNPYMGKDVTENVEKRTKTVLGQMKKFEYITQEEYDGAVAEVEAGFNFENGAKGNIYSSHTDALINQLIKQIMEEKQISENAAKTYLYSSGLKIYSTQVSSIQNVMENEAKNKKYNLTSKITKDENGVGVLAQGAAVVIDQSTGYVVGCIGQLGEKTMSRGLNRATSPRSTGSAFKPLADVLPGLEEGIITPATIYADLQTTFGTNYTPKNYNSFTTLRTIRNSLTTSQNIPFIKVMAELTPKKSMEYLRKMGISSLDDTRDDTLSLAIGGQTYGVSPLEMAAAYACIANNGTYIEPTFYSKVEDNNGKIVLDPKQRTERVCSEETAYLIKDMLKTVVTGTTGYGGTATYCAIKGIDVAAKTGTTNNNIDRWLCGFTNYYTAAAWYGFDIQETTDRFKGTNPAGQLFDGIMTEIHKGKEASTFQKPEGVVTATVCRVSGRLATDKCHDTYSEIFIKDKLPEACDAHQGQFTICQDSGKLPNEFCPESSKVTKSKGYIVEKERLGLWNTPGINTTTENAPTDYCTIHQKVEVVVPEKPNTSTEEPTEKPNEKPDEGNDTNPGDNTGSGNTTQPEEPNNPDEGDLGNTTAGNE